MRTYIAFITCVVCLFGTNQREQMKKGDRAHRIFKQKEQLWEDKAALARCQRESIAVVNQHYHDMKHQLMILSTMSDEDKRKAKL